MWSVDLREQAIGAPGFSTLFQTLVSMAESATDTVCCVVVHISNPHSPNQRQALLQSSSLALLGYVQSAALSEQHLMQLLGVVRRLLSDREFGLCRAFVGALTPPIPECEEEAAAHVGKLILKVAFVVRALFPTSQHSNR